MSTEAKVGAFTIIAAVLLGYLCAYIGGWHFGTEKGYELQAVFRQVNGLQSGSIVRYAGVQVGSVRSIMTDGSGAIVTLHLNDDVKIPKDAYITITGDGIMGEKFVGISPGTVANGEFYAPGEQARGYDEQGLNEMIATANTVLLDVQKLVSSLQTVFGDAKVQQALVDSALSMQSITANINDMTAAMSRVAVDSEQDVRLIVNQLGAMAQNMAAVSARLDTMLADIDNNGQTASDMRQAIANLRQTGERVERMAQALEGIVTDPQTADDLKAALHNVRNASERADKMLAGVDSLQVKPGAELLYSGGEDRYKVNADLRIYTSPHSYLLLGVNDIGETNKGNFQLARGNGTLTGRMGIFDNKPGLGLDAALNEDWQFSVAAYDPNDVRLRVRAEYEFAPNISLVGQSDDVNKSRYRKSYVGLRYGF